MNKEQYIDFPHPEYSNTYKVSNFGNIKNNKTNKLVTTCKSFDYVCIRIDNVIFRVNKLTLLKRICYFCLLGYLYFRKILSPCERSQ